MNKILPALLACLISGILAAQDVRLNDSVIFISDKPVALYEKQLSNSPQRYNMEVYSFDDYVLIKAEVIKFDAPVAELKPFYYYELTFPPTADTFAIYIEDEAFPLTLSKIIRDYDLISKNQLNRKNLRKFISTYYGGPALTEKIKSFEDYLNETRYFNEQVKRDRTKPVTIINNRIIMQDGVKIGLVARYLNTTPGYSYHNYDPEPVATYVTSGSGVVQKIGPQLDMISTNETQVLLTTGRRVDNLRFYKYWTRDDHTSLPPDGKRRNERSLYQVSKAADKRIGAETDSLLRWVCYLIEDYAL